MWWFNPGNPARGTVRYAEESVNPPTYMKQVSIPPFYRMTVPADLAISEQNPEAAGEVLLRRLLPNAMTRSAQDFWVDEDPFDYIQVANRTDVPLIYEVVTGIAWESGDYHAVYELNIGEQHIQQLSLTEGEVVELFEAESGLAPISVQSVSHTIPDFFAVGDPITVQILRVKMPAETDLQVECGVGYTDAPLEEEPFVTRVLSFPVTHGTQSLWVLSWLGDIQGPPSRPYLRFAKSAMFEVISPAQLPDAMRQFRVSGRELLMAGDEVILGQPVGEFDVSPAWV